MPGLCQVNNTWLEPTYYIYPCFRYVANMHGDETVGRQLIVYFAEYLLQNYENDDRVKNLVDSVEIYLQAIREGRIGMDPHTKVFLFTALECTGG